MLEPNEGVTVYTGGRSASYFKVLPGGRSTVLLSLKCSLEADPLSVLECSIRALMKGVTDYTATAYEEVTQNASVWADFKCSVIALLKRGNRTLIAIITLTRKS